jgi:hypothetical protein
VPYTQVNAFLESLSNDSFHIHLSARHAIVGFLETIVVDIVETFASLFGFPDNPTIYIDPHMISTVLCLEWTKHLAPHSPLAFSDWISARALNDPASRLTLALAAHDPAQKLKSYRPLTVLEPWSTVRTKILAAAIPFRSELDPVERPCRFVITK